MKKLICVIVFFWCGVCLAGPPGTPTKYYKKRYEFTTDATLSSSQSMGKVITNQGASGEVDIMLADISETAMCLFILEEAQNIEINPPTGELLDLDGTNLDANDCIDSDSTVGSMIMLTRQKIADGTWQWFANTIRGVWTDTGASD